MKKSMKSIVSCLLAVFVIAGCFTTAMAAEKAFTKKSVDSNTYTYITSAVKDTKTSTATIKITNIYKADGSTSGYSYVYVKATSTGSETSVMKGSYYDVVIPSASQSAGSSVSLYAKGNTPWLDCQISGTWNVH